MSKTFLNKVAEVVKKETMTQVYSCCEIFKNPFFVEHLWWLLLTLGRNKSKKIIGNSFFKTQY